MPTLNIEGKSVQVDDSFMKLSPEDQNKTVDEIASSMKIAPQQSAPVTAKGLAKSFGVGTGEGLLGLVGAPADLTDLASRGLDYVAGTKTHDTIAPYTKALGSENIKKKIEGYTGEFYKPQNTAEGIFNTAGSFAPLVAAGPGGIARKVLTNVVAPTVGSEVAGAVTQGTDAEPYARAAGAIVGGAGASKLGRALDAGAVAKATPSIDDLAKSSTASYQHPDVTSLRLKPAGIDNLVTGIDAELLQNKVDKFNAPQVAGIVERMAKPRFGAEHEVADLDLARQSLSDVPYQEKRAAAVARGVIDKYLGNIPQADVVAGSAAKANAKLLEARGDYAAMKRSQEITGALGRAENQAGATYSGGNLENATRQQLKPILNQKMGVAKSRGFQDYTDPEIAAIKKAVVGTQFGNLVRGSAKFLGGGGGLGMLASGSAGYEAGGIPGALAAGLAAKGLNRFGARLATNRATQLDSMLRSRSPLAQQSLPQMIAALQQSNSPIAQAILKALTAQQQASMPMLSQGVAR